MSSTNCPKCGGTMERGWIMDVGQNGTRRVLAWSPGTAIKSVWTGMRKPELEVPVGQFRCTECGYLEAYARPEFRALKSREVERVHGGTSQRKVRADPGRSPDVGEDAGSKAPAETPPEDTHRTPHRGETRGW